MSSKEIVSIDVNNLEMFEETLKALSKIVSHAKFIINGAGLSLYSINAFARTEIETNCVSSETPVEFCMADVNVVLKLLNTIHREFGKNEKPDLKINFDGQFLYFNSSRAKARLITCKEDVVAASISLKKVSTPLTPVFEFKTNNAIIKNIIGNTYMFADPESARIYLKTNVEGMQKNMVYANVDNKQNAFSSSVMLKLGMITSGELNREIILDLARLQIFNMIDTPEMLIQLMDKNVLVSNITKISEDKKTSINLKIFNSLRKN